MLLVSLRAFLTGVPLLAPPARAAAGRLAWRRAAASAGGAAPPPEPPAAAPAADGPAAGTPQRTPQAAPRKIPRVKRVGRDDVDIQFARSSGAGGQNVNKVNTKVDLRLNLRRADWLDPEVRAALEAREKNRVNGAGELVVQSQRTRKQADNVDDALEKLQEMLDAAWQAVQPIEEDPAKKRKLAKQKERGNEARLLEKKFKADKKKERRSKADW